MLQDLQEIFSKELEVHLHWVDNKRYTSQEKKEIKSCKIKTLLQRICANSRKIRDHPEKISIDESMIPYKGKTSRIRQFIANKPSSVGL